ncbi:uncharacterized protein N7479_005350 [Penicillium vulpinum]|uniref:uncharacterized protein n=1 Tax=Penicillium vulpinum TaxID=29845 RepID=UPI00254860BD|nr:uncharacterized protein N7479_005350 [Penicillium vulpinum]KAJ5958200.1 hypothetical protein N7479_005350 [Penicillium vulpinum]
MFDCEQDAFIRTGNACGGHHLQANHSAGPMLYRYNGLLLEPHVHELIQKTKTVTMAGPIAALHSWSIEQSPPPVRLPTRTGQQFHEVNIRRNGWLFYTRGDHKRGDWTRCICLAAINAI